MKSKMALKFNLPVEILSENGGINTLGGHFTSQKLSDEELCLHFLVLLSDFLHLDQSVA